MNNHTLKQVVILVLMIFFIIPSLPPTQATPEQNNEAGKNNRYEEKYCVTFSENDLIFTTVMGYNMVQLKDGSCLNEIGKPVIPVKEIKIALPTGMKVTQVQVVDIQSKVIKGKYTLFPAQPPKRTDGTDDTAALVKPDSKTYMSMQPYPGKVVEFAQQTDLAGQGIAVIDLYPVQYVPGEKKLTLYTSITFLINGFDGYSCGDYLPISISENGKATYEQMIKEMVINPEDVQVHNAPPSDPPVLALPPGGPYNHVIITTNSLSSYWAPLVEWHTKRGLKDIVVTTGSIYANYTGSTNQQKIRNFVIDAYNTWSTMYFLMAGEPSSVPIQYQTYYDESTPSDQYYSDFDNDWTHEVFVGRVTANSAAEIDLFLDKLLFYEKTPTMTDYLLKVGLFGFDADSATHCEYLMETIAGYIPTQFTKNKVYDSYGTNHLTAVTNYLNAGQHLVAHADHGDFNWWGIGYTNHGTGMYSSAVDALTNNNKMSIVTTLACDVNGFDQSSDSFSEHWVIYNSMRAGLAFNGNTRLGYYYSGQPAALSGQLVRDWYYGLFSSSQNKYILGETIIYSKHQFSHSDGVRRHCEWEFSLLGEPAMPIWTDTPASFTVTHPTTLPLGSSSFTVHVTSGGGPVNQAYVCLWKSTEVYLTGNTDTNGDITFTPAPSTLGTMYVTVTKHNYLPYEGSAEVIQNLPPTVVNLYPSSSTVCRTHTITILSNAEDDNDPESALLCEMEYQAPSGTWTALSDETFVGDHWVALFTPAFTAELGAYNFRVRYRDLDMEWCTWYEVDNMVTVQDQFTLFEELGHNYSQCIAVGDVDSDGNLDLAISIIQPNGTDPTQIYHNDGDGTFTLQHLLCGPSFYTYTNLFGDINRDGYLDLMTVGGWQMANPGQIWINDGTGGFTAGQTLDPTYTKGAVTGDIDNDGDTDLVTSYQIYRNDGTGQFTAESCEELGFYIRAVTLGDVNNDGSLDILTGREGGIKICLNDGTGHFTATEQNLGNNDTHDLVLGDLDNDGDLDLIAANERHAVEEPNRVYLNDGTGFFTDTGQQLGHAPTWSLALGDIDHDGDLDLITGNNYWYPNELYLNDGQGIFSLSQTVNAEGTMDVALADIDNDGDLDLIAPNYFNTSDYVYVNNEPSVNSAPLPPTSLVSTPSSDLVTLNWSAGSDDMTPSNILTYNVRVGTSPGYNDVISGVIPAGTGNVGHHLGFTLHNLAAGTYYWSVQTIDGSYTKSVWSTEGSFTILP